MVLQNRVGQDDLASGTLVEYTMVKVLMDDDFGNALLRLLFRTSSLDTFLEQRLEKVVITDCEYYVPLQHHNRALSYLLGQVFED